MKKVLCISLIWFTAFILFSIDLHYSFYGVTYVESYPLIKSMVLSFMILMLFGIPIIGICLTGLCNNRHEND